MSPPSSLPPREGTIGVRGWVPAAPRVLEAPGARALLLALGVLVLAGGGWAWSARSTVPTAPAVLLTAGVPVAVTPSPGPSGSGSSGAPGLGSPGAPAAGDPGAAGPAVVVVQVLGAVRRPGVVRLTASARVVDALAAAGGLRPGARTGCLNLARRVADGEQLVVGPSVVPCPGATPSGGTVEGPTAGGGVIDLNTATAADLDTLPGVGPVLAGRIIEWRTAHGRFGSVDELRDVPGIGDRTFATLSPRLRV